MGRIKRQLLEARPAPGVRAEPLAVRIAKTDLTFTSVTYRDRPAWAGKCIHCGSHIGVSQDGETFGATIEHIVPKNHGGTDELGNVALACAGCNNAKGVHLDRLPLAHPKLQAMIKLLLRRRRARWKDG